MTKEQILEGLRRHGDSGKAIGGCWKYDEPTDTFKSYCPYFNEDNCHQALLTDAIGLIESQDALINKLYLEIKAKWNRLRAENDLNNQSVLRFLVRLMEMIEEAEDSEGGGE